VRPPTAQVATALLAALVEPSGAGGIWTLEAGILPENEAGVRMHERCSGSAG
jgi:L-amino acid N-acyltransferase YncA